MRRFSVAAVAVLLAAVAVAGEAPSPRQVLGIDVGADRVLASYADTERYLRELASRSDRVELLQLGATVEDRAILGVVIGSPGNLVRLAELKEGWRRVADPRGLSVAEREKLIATLPACALIAAGIHSTEVAGPQAALLFAHRLANAAAGSGEAAWLDRVVVLVVPSLNPDGQEQVVEWYRRWLGTPYEGASPPFLYHRFAGHDNNRDFVFLTQPESRALNRFVYREWRPQLFLDLHQMGSLGPRQFVPPFADPIAANVHPLVWRLTSHLGSLMALRLEEHGRQGVISGWTFDGNWIGGTRNTGWWKNVIGVLTETASAALATPIDVDRSELKGGGKGLSDYRAQVNFPTPWQGGRWGLSDAVGYQIDIMAAFVEFAALHRPDVLRDVSRMAANAVARGEREDPHGWLVPPDPEDPGRSRRLVDLLVEGGADALTAPAGLVADGLVYPPGTVVFPAAQPLRQFLAEVLEAQHYPRISPAPGAEILLPYDVTAWTMPLYFGVEVRPIRDGWKGNLVPVTERLRRSAPPLAGRGSRILLPATQLDSFAVANQALAQGGDVRRLTAPVDVEQVRYGPGSFVIGGLSDEAIASLLAGRDLRAVRAAPQKDTVRLGAARVAVHHPDFGVEDAGWLRWALEQARFEVETIDDRQIAAGDLRKVRVLAIAPLEGSTIVDGPARRGAVAPPPRFQHGIGKEGVAAIKSFFADGGTVIGFGASAEWLADILDLPVSNPLRGLPQEQYWSPGALLSLVIDPSVRVAWGMPSTVAAMVEGPAALATRPVVGDEQRVVAARYPEQPEVLSGWLRGEEKLASRAAIVEVRRGPGRAVLFAFAPYFRGQTLGTFPLLYNAVLTEAADPERSGR